MSDTNAQIPDVSRLDSETRKYVAEIPLPADGIFEIALILGGTVSAGAYTAGVLDFLIEALDSWASRRDEQNDPKVPTHKVVLKVITGTSGGGVNAAIATRALAFDFDPVHHDTPLDKARSNPFYDTWVNRLALDQFLDPGDLQAPPIPALLNAAAIDNGAIVIESFTGPPKPSRAAYLSHPLTTMLTVTNLRGVPYVTPFNPSSSSGTASGETFVNHADYGRFAVTYPWCAQPPIRNDEFSVGFAPNDPVMNGWRTLSQYARGTSAFPAGFPPRNLSRVAQQYHYRVALVPGDGRTEPDRILPLTPDWSQIVASGLTPQASDYKFPVVDGGATDNEPIELARVALSGLGARNPRDGTAAKRALILVDPFGGGASTGPETLPGLLGAIGPLLKGMIQQTRYESRDVLLALNENVFSRFMISARRDKPSSPGQWYGDPALATSGLAAFMGFACADFRRHDYLLGRRNCQAFLRRSFMLPEGASGFGKGWDTVTDKSRFIVTESGITYLPIIPLFGAVDIEEPLPDWPAGKLQLENLRHGIEQRVVALATALVGAKGWAAPLVWMVMQVFKRRISTWVLGAMEAALKKAELL